MFRAFNFRVTDHQFSQTRKFLPLLFRFFVGRAIERSFFTIIVSLFLSLISFTKHDQSRKRYSNTPTHEHNNFTRLFRKIKMTEKKREIYSNERKWRSLRNQFFVDFFRHDRRMFQKKKKKKTKKKKRNK